MKPLLLVFLFLLGCKDDQVEKNKEEIGYMKTWVLHLQIEQNCLRRYIRDLPSLEEAKATLEKRFPTLQIHLRPHNTEKGCTHYAIYTGRDEYEGEGDLDDLTRLVLRAEKENKKECEENR